MNWAVDILLLTLSWGRGGIFDIIKNFWGWNNSLSSEDFCREYNMATTTPLKTHYKQLVLLLFNNRVFRQKQKVTHDLVNLSQK